MKLLCSSRSAICCFALTVFIFAMNGASAQSGRFVSEEGGITLSYTVKDGYKVKIQVDTREKKSAYAEFVETDVTAIKVDFVDLNGDGLDDLIIKYADETGYSPVVLINKRNSSFVNALPQVKGGYYINTEVEIAADGKAIRRRDYEVRCIKGCTTPELIFFRLTIGNDAYAYTAFRYDSRTMTYELVPPVPSKPSPH